MSRTRKSSKNVQSCENEASTSLSCANEKVDDCSSNNLKEECKIWVLRIESLDDTNFISPDDISFQSTVFAKLRICCLSPQWINEEECLKISQRRNEIFVLPFFSGRVFDHLSSIHCRTYGSLAVLSCLNAGERLPKWTHPIQSVTLKNAVICFTGLDYAIREVQTGLIMRMGGIVSRDFNEEVTHLVAAEHNNNSKKYNAAVQRKIPVMSFEWLEKAWEAASKFNEVRFTDDDVVDMYRLKLFSGCLMTCSGVSLQERLLLGQLIEENGGNFKGDMERHKCSHLLTDLNSGEKYRKAREWGWETIKIVRVAWLAKCIEKGYRLPERLYEPKLPVKCSTPKNSLLASPANFEFSSIPESRTHLYDTLEQTGASFTSALNESHDENRVGGTVTAVEQIGLAENRMLRKTFSSRLVEDSHNVDPIESLDLSHLDTDDLLEGYRVFFCGVDNSHLCKWKRLANVMGASVSSVLNDTITHVILGNMRIDSKIIAELSAVSPPCPIVKCEWLIECAKVGRLLPTSNFKSCSLGNDDARHVENRAIKKSFVKVADSQDPKINMTNPTNATLITDHFKKTLTPSISKGFINPSLASPMVKDLSEPNKVLLTKQLEHLRSSKRDKRDKPGSSDCSLIDSPSVFLNPQENFIPRFDLKQAYEYVDGLQSFEQLSDLSDHSSWSESAVGKLLHQAIAKTSRENHEIIKDQKSAVEGLPSMKVALEVNQYKVHNAEEEKGIVSNEEKTRMIERCLANLANCDDEKVSMSSVRSRKRSISKVDGSLSRTFRKHEVEKTNSASLICSAHEFPVDAGNIGWEEGIHSRQRNDGTIKSAAIAHDEHESQNGSFVFKEKLIPLNFSTNEEIIFIEKQEAQNICAFKSPSISGASNVKNMDEIGNGKAICSAAAEDANAGGKIQSTSSILPEDNVSEGLMGLGKRSRNCVSLNDVESASNCGLLSKRVLLEKQRMVFLLSSLDEVKRQRYATAIESLGGELSMEFSDSVRFLVCGDIVRNEKLLTSIACGLFVLQPEFLDDSEKAGHWLQPEDYEWGSSDCMAKHRFPNKKLEMLAAACRRWRLKIGKTFPKKKAFSGWNVLLYCSRRRSIDIGRIISFGGGASVLRDDVEMIDGFTHALVERSKYWNDKEIDALGRRHVNCYNMDFIANFLTIENIIEKEYFHPEYLRHLPKEYLE